MNTNTTTTEETDEVYTMFPLHSTKFEPIHAAVRVNKVPIKMEGDTGATLSVVSEATYKQVRGDNGPTLKREKELRERECRLREQHHHEIQEREMREREKCKLKCNVSMSFVRRSRG